ncbi:hypothetical protein [Treponema putidum]|uniref:Uncharacterized protein n=1 Tax=Treponema putidum TaxID=221027 RepID=A0AAE9MS37_9SPIR|nr:hypothetical protein [Treponema putidum]AIN92816.1 hypothetical protein JO40_00655 [Treponema putidum]TWI74043.1 hypothetical protein JM98_02217 [Treponema putidum]UTY29068.1 hypothetical protein E4N76_08830 [Treponema putidum]UTY31463.1 hypothetical protein E4N75_08155 [Treponema putidum]UTY33910.1 hypothetical protein E4N74_07785 [Treponema putidum]
MKRTVGLVVLQIALAFFLIVAGILGLIRSSAGELGQAISLLDVVFKSRTITTVIIITLAVAELIAGVFLIVEFFSGEIRLTGIILIVFMILWIVNIVLIDIIGPINGNIFTSTMSVLNYLSQLSRHLMILGAIIAVKDKSRV